MKPKTKKCPKELEFLKLISIYLDGKKINPKETVEKTINFIPNKLKLIYNWLGFHLLLMSILFKLPHFYYGMFV